MASDNKLAQRGKLLRYQSDQVLGHSGTSVAEKMSASLRAEPGPIGRARLKHRVGLDVSYRLAECGVCYLTPIAVVSVRQAPNT